MIRLDRPRKDTISEYNAWKDKISPQLLTYWMSEVEVVKLAVVVSVRRTQVAIRFIHLFITVTIKPIRKYYFLNNLWQFNVYMFKPIIQTIGNNLQKVE